VHKVNLEKLHHSSRITSATADKFLERLGIDRGDIGGVSSEREGAVDTGKSLKVASLKKGTKKENVRMVLRLPRRCSRNIASPTHHTPKTTPLQQNALALKMLTKL